MGKINKDSIFRFVELQCQLVLEFMRTHPDVKDFTWLLDFPKAGEVFVGGDEWRFIRHGSGLRFEKKRVSRAGSWMFISVLMIPG
jgi:hypothetical protein